MEILQNRYDNRRLILRAHIHGIVSYRPVSHENTWELRKLVDTMEEHRLSLRNMGQQVEHQDPFFVYLIAEKLPTETRKFWELSSKGKELQTYQELKTFLEERVQALESAAPSNSSSNTKNDRIRNKISHRDNFTLMLRQRISNANVVKRNTEFSNVVSSKV